MTTSSRIPSPGDVVILRVDFMDGTGDKIRPAVVLSPYDFNQSRDYFIFTPLTGSAGSFRDPARLEIMDIRAAGLNGRSFTHGVIATANNRQIRRTVGRLSSRDRTEIRRLLADVIAL